MAEPKVRPTKISMKRGVQKVLVLRYTATVGTDLSTWQSAYVLKSCEGDVLFTETVALVPEVGTPHIARATHVINKDVTSALDLGEKQNNHAIVRNGTGQEDCFFHGPVDAYVVSGGGA